MYELLFIDEEKETLEDFEDFVENFPAKIELKAITQVPLADKEEMIELIIKLSPDALIADFRLNEMKTDIDTPKIKINLSLYINLLKTKN